ncbi:MULTISPECIES: phosphonate C-P lyase system protein PhnH [Methylobacterium]|jgi:alpha-D-ribose 1-methylphosphonate 5-triphosphate synthase subunit PhnH|uniref:phosphonate C-P lyase system protein PhnH n=1 Tax=Methylobacterium TaxID=407 RepID=UPI0008E74B61|nr:MULTISPECIES: phosphonate C-P lyase system protein PhnH [Methylobacterium]MBZ6414135.1 phosphonate C-P lyase system protein PhnH [Methylobacterium sp.]MBK3398303.1 phosphonate C-P lyase system protein PhnH [Methylobacterium ajmalii]MBK3408492.1 phosphonate C-P lyase system protein PhnH [Methylobacterium ajmalii]MBK3421031.1 phosphonate C-P lyase system protein PhnH [Methylobacterium ajmalii]SFF62108.1 alpha-D-ribose 1-methylphosphonate 5-triphosphate synthase subunit PhnH [Methylobacterium 
MLARGFADPVHNAQRVFRAVMDALARPGTIQALATGLAPPAPLTPELAAVALALADADAPLWLDAGLAESPAVAEFLRFHTGARITDDPAEAAFALVSDAAACPTFDAFAQGTPAYPDRSATLVLAVSDLSDREGWHLDGPGIRDSARLAASPLPADMPARLARNHAGFPQGIDLILAAPGRVAALPRSTRVQEG